MSVWACSALFPEAMRRLCEAALGNEQDPQVNGELAVLSADDAPSSSMSIGSCSNGLPGDRGVSVVVDGWVT